MILTGKIGYIKRRPKAHKLEGFMTTQHAGFVLAMMPHDYPMTAPQKKVRDAAKACGIKKGISRKTLVDAMINCIPGKF